MEENFFEEKRKIQNDFHDPVGVIFFNELLGTFTSNIRSPYHFCYGLCLPRLFFIYCTYMWL